MKGNKTTRQRCGRYEWRGGLKPGLAVLATLALGTVCGGAAEGLVAYSLLTRDGRRMVSRTVNGVRTYELVPTNALPANLPPVRAWTIYGIKSAHSDLGLHRSNYVQRKGTVLRIDEAGRLMAADRRADGDPAAMRYVIEGWWSWLNYPLEKGEAEARSWIRRWTSRGRLDVGGNLCGLVTHVFGYEELCRSLYPKLEMESRWGVRSRTAQMVDNPGVTSALISPLVEAGIAHLAFWPNRYASSGGKTLCITGDRRHPELFWWEAPNGRDRVLVWTGPSYVSGGYLLGPNTAFIDRPSHPFPRAAVLPPPDWKPNLADWEKKCTRGLATLESRYPYDVWLYPDYHDDELPSTRLADAFAAWNAKWATPVFRTVGSLDEPFDRVKAKWGDRIPVVRGDISSAWASMSTAVAELHARKLAADRALPLTEALRVIAALEKGEPFPKDDLDHAYEALLLNDDHSYGFSGYTGRRVYDTWAQHRDWIEFAEGVAGSAGETAEVSPEGVAGVAENKWYRIAVTNGVIHSIYDKDIGRELLEGPANRLLYTRNRYRTFESDPAAALKGRVTQKVWLDPNEKCIRIENAIASAGDLLNRDRMKRFGHYAFPFKVAGPVFRSQLNGPVIDAHAGLVPHVADSVSVVRDWCAVEGEGFGVALIQNDTQVVEFGRLNGWPVYGFRGRPNRGHIYSRAFDDGLQWHLAEPPSFRFRYAITSYRGRWQEAHVPALAARLVRDRGRAAKIARRLAMDKINLEFVSLKFAEDGNGLIARFRETEGRETEGVLRQTLIPAADVRRVTVLERTMDQTGAFRFRPFETRSYRLTGVLPKIALKPDAPWTGLLTRPRAFPGGVRGQLYLLWTADRRPAFDHYELFRDGVKIADVPNAFEDGYLLANVPHEDTGLEPGRAYRYQVRTVLKDGTRGAMSESFVGKTRP